MNIEERNKNSEEFFNNKYDTYDDVHKVFMDTKRQMIDNLDADTKKVLDLGVGTGLELIHLFELYPNIKVTGIDISKNMLSILKSREFIDKIEIIEGDFFKVDFSDIYDAVITTSVLHHFSTEHKIILYKKIYECLCDNGLFLNADKVAKDKKEELLGFEEYNKYKDIRPHIDTPLSIETEIELLKLAGFKSIEVIDTYNTEYKLIKARK